MLHSSWNIHLVAMHFIATLFFFLTWRIKILLKINNTVFENFELGMLSLKPLVSLGCVKYLLYGSYWLTKMHNLKVGDYVLFGRQIEDFSLGFSLSGFPCWYSGKESTFQCRSARVRSIPWKRKWQRTPGFLPGETTRAEEPVGLQSMGSQNSQTGLSAQELGQPLRWLWGIVPKRKGSSQDV